MASAASSSGPAAAASVTVEDESTKQCSSCLEDRLESSYSSAQLKKKGKRVCSHCVAKKTSAEKEAAAALSAAARKASMKGAFAVRLDATPHAPAVQCLRCQSQSMTAVRFAPCIRCTVPCCSLKCFDEHDCDAYLEAKRTMPTDLIPLEDRFHSEAELRASWKELFDYLRGLPATVSEHAVQSCAKDSKDLSESDGLICTLVDMLRLPICGLYDPCVSFPWWNPAASTRAGPPFDIHALVTQLIKHIALISHECVTVVLDCANVVSSLEHKAAVHGAWTAVPTLNRASPCFLPGRLLHKLLTLVRWIVRVIGPQWTSTCAHSFQPGDVSSDVFGFFPASPAEVQGQVRVHLGYLELPAPGTGLRTLVPLADVSPALSRVCVLRQHVGHRELLMVLDLCDGLLQLDRGLYLTTAKDNTVVAAVSGWTGNVMDSFTIAPVQSAYWSDQWLLRSCQGSYAAAAREELEARGQQDYFHIILAIKQMIPEDEWPSAPGSTLFIATPQLGIESELVELSLLESLVEEAAAGDAQARLLLTHIESECAAPIAEVIARQKSRLEQMLQDQAAQLQIHAEAVARAELRGRIKAAAAVEGSSEGAASSSIGASSSSASASASTLAPSSAASSSSAVAPSSAASAVAPSAAAGSSTALSSVCAASAASGESAVSYSWTASKAYASLASVCTAGRAKYKTIMSAALRFLHTLSPVSVNRSGGSHTVFHFASGSPVTLVQPHGGDGTVSRHAATRLYAVLHEAALQQLSPAELLSSASRGGRAALTEAAL